MEALKQVLAWSPARIQATVEPMTTYLAKGARALDFQVPQYHAPHFLGVGPGPQDVPVSMQSVDAKELWADEAAAHLKSRKIYVSSRGGALRIAIHVYNTIEEIDALLLELRDLAQVRRRKASL